MTQTQFAKALGLSRDFVGQMERGAAPIAPRTALAVRQLKPAPTTVRSSDPMEKIVEEALIDARIDFLTERDGDTRNLDFYLPKENVFIEVKRMHSPRIAEQTSRAENVIVAQGEAGVQFLANAIRAGSVSRLATSPSASMDRFIGEDQFAGTGKPTGTSGLATAHMDEMIRKIREAEAGIARFATLQPGALARSTSMADAVKAGYALMSPQTSFMRQAMDTIKAIEAGIQKIAAINEENASASDD